MANSSSPVVIITEQPAGFYRYRYESEGKSKIPGAHSKLNNKTFPTIQILGYVGKVLIIISCVSKDKPHKRHPHNIVGNGENFKHGIYVDYVTVGTTNTFTFNGLGIQCISVKKDKQKKTKKSKLEKSQNESEIDLTAVRLKFEVYLRGPTKYDIALDPVYSEPIFNATAYPSLTICKLSHCSSPTVGGQTILLFCDKVNKEDIAVIFFEEINGETKWEAPGTCLNVHRTFGISLVTPKYGGSSYKGRPIKCFIQLKRISDGEKSEPREFDYTPMYPNDLDSIDLKRKKVKVDPMLLKFLNKRDFDKGEPSTSNRLPKSPSAQIQNVLPIPNYESFPVNSDKNRMQQSISYLEAGVLDPTMLEQQTVPNTNYDNFPGTSAVMLTHNPQVNDFGYADNNFITNDFEGQELLNFIQNFDQPNRNMETNQNQEQFNILPNQNLMTQNTTIDEVDSEETTPTTDELLLSFCNEVIQTNLEEERNLSGRLENMMLMNLMN